MAFRCVRRSFVALLAVGLGLVGLAGPASAHDTLVSSDPADGATVVTVPAALTLEFSDEVVATGTEVVVTSGGADVGAAAAQVDGATVTVALPPDLPGGEYDVAWRAVSADGHPIEGTLGFVIAESTPSPDPTDQAATADPTSPAPVDATAGDEPDDAATAPGEAQGIDPSPAPEGVTPSGRSPWIAVIAGLGVVATMTALAVARRRGTRGFGPPGQD